MSSNEILFGSFASDVAPSFPVVALTRPAFDSFDNIRRTKLGLVFTLLANLLEWTGSPLAASPNDSPGEEQDTKHSQACHEKGGPQHRQRERRLVDGNFPFHFLTAFAAAEI